MTLDELIDALHALRARYPSAGTAYVDCAVDLEAVMYVRGEVQLGFEFAKATRRKKRDAKPTRVH